MSVTLYFVPNHFGYKQSLETPGALSIPATHMTLGYIKPDITVTHT